MATSNAEFRNLVSNYKSITAASRASGNTDPAIRGQLEGLQSSLAPYVAEGYSAGGYDDAATISSDVASIIRLIDQNIADGKSANKDPVAEKTDENKPDTKSAGDNKAKDDTVIKSGTTVSGSGNKPVTAAQGSSNKAKVAMDANSGLGKRTWNPLGDLSSYTYKISLYALPPEAINHYNETGSWFKNDLYLVCQSGGINSNPAIDAQRAPGFDLDFFIDDVEYSTSINSKDLKQSSNTTNIKFKVTEPYGATFPQKLVEAQKAINAKSKFPRKVTTTNESLWGHYLITFTFYGYDENGQILNPDKYNLSGAATGKLDDTGIFERAFPVYITDFKFRLDGKGQVYDIDTMSINTGVGLGTKRGEVSTELTAQGKTVEEVLGGNAKTTTGLIDELNKRSSAGKGTVCEIPDQYAIVYEENSTIKTATIVSEDLNKDKTPMASVSGAGGSNVVKSASASSATMTPKRIIKIAGGTPIVQAIDQIISQSSYISDSLKVLESEDPQPAREGAPLDEDNARAKPLQWYIILPVTDVLGFDKLRNDYAYKITYVVKSYEVPYVRTDAISKVPKYPGPHKIYNYWYTGKNSEVISYEQNNNIGYFLYLGAQSKDASKDNTNTGVRYQAKPANNADSTSKAPGSFEGANSIKSFLYSPEDLNEAKITILGDPDFLMPVTSGTIGQMMQKWYGPNFTINPNSGQVFIEVIFNQTEDYSHQTGTLPVLDVLDFNNFANQPKPGVQEIVKGTVFMVHTVLSRFNNGKFTQDFDVGLPNFNEMSKNDTGESAIPGNSSGTDRAPQSSSVIIKGNNTAATQGRATVLLLNSAAGGGRGSQGGPSASQGPYNNFNTSFNSLKNIALNPNLKSTVNDDELFIATSKKSVQGGRENPTSPYKR